MRLKSLLLIVPFLLAVGCAKDESPKATADQPAQANAKPGEKMQGISADQVGVTNAGANADKATGSKIGG